MLVPVIMTGIVEMQPGSQAFLSLEPLEPREQRFLLTVARRTLEVALRTGELYEVRVPANCTHVIEKRGVFLTLYRKGELRGCVGSHRWERVVDEPGRIGYRFTRCMWAEAFRELGEPELGLVICAGDEPMVRSYNPDLGFRRTKVLMLGDDVCDHVFLVEPEDS